MFTAEEQQQMIALRGLGQSLREIAKVWGISHEKVRVILRENGTETGRMSFAKAKERRKCRECEKDAAHYQQWCEEHRIEVRPCSICGKEIARRRGVKRWEECAWICGGRCHAVIMARGRWLKQQS